MSIIFSGFLLTGGSAYIINQTEQNLKIENTSNYWVDIKGAVLNASLYKVKENTKLEDVIYKAHLLMSSDISKINLNYIIRNDYNVYIPYKEGKQPKINAKDGLTFIRNQSIRFK